MAIANITPPQQTLGIPSVDYSTGKDNDGVPVNYCQQTKVYRADEALSAGQAVSFTAITAAKPLSVVASNTGTALDEELIAGIVVNDCAAGELAQVADVAYARLADATTTTRGEACPLSATDGILGEGEAATTTNDITHPFLVLQDSIADYWASGVDGVLVKLRNA